MRCTRRMFGSAGRLTVILGAVLYGCAFFVPAVGTAAGITVEIIRPEPQDRIFDIGREHEFEAVAFVEGQELPGGQVTWDWDFGDNTPHSNQNPTVHTYALRGSLTVTVTATYGALSGQGTMGVQSVAAGSEDIASAFVVEARATSWYGPTFQGQEVCDLVQVIVRAPMSRTNAMWQGAYFYGYHTGIALFETQCFTLQTEEREGETWEVPSTGWATEVDLNNQPVRWLVKIAVVVPPPDGEEPPFVQDIWLPERSWTPRNLVIKNGLPEVIVHHAGTANHTLGWETTRCVDAALSPNLYSPYVEIYDIGGNRVNQDTMVTPAVTVNGPGAWVWTPDEQIRESDGLYSFRISANQQSDKSGCLVISGVDQGSSRFHLDMDDLMLKGSLAYTLSMQAAECKIEIYGPSLTPIAEIQAPTGPGTHEVSYGIGFDRESGWGHYRAIITAKETEAHAAGCNREGVVQRAIPKGCYLGGISGPPASIEIAEPDGTPITDNHVAFDDSVPGLCVFAATGIVKDAQGNRLQYLEPALSWTVGVPSGSTLSTDPSPPKGTVPQFAYSALPSQNSEFGAKLLTLTHPLVQAPDQQGIEVFFQKDATNHPGGGVPNWYYYWKQTAANTADPHHFITYDDPDYPEELDHLGDQVLGYYTSGQDHFHICPRCGDSIDFFASTCRHERRHLDVYAAHWPNGYNQLEDMDADQLRDDLEPAMGYNPILRTTFPQEFGGQSDNENDAYRAGATWQTGGARDEDWSMPGTHAD